MEKFKTLKGDNMRTRVGKFMVYNPRAEKPTKIYPKKEEAIQDAKTLNEKTGEDFLILKIIANVEKDKIKILKTENSSQEESVEIIDR